MYPIYIKIKSLLNFKKLLQIVVLTFLTQFSLAGTDLLATYSGGAVTNVNNIQVGQPIGAVWGWTGSQLEICRFPKVAFYEAELSPSTSFTGMNTAIDGESYPVFTTTIPGIGWVMSYKPETEYNYYPVLNTQNKWISNPKYNYRVGGDFRVTLIKTGNITSSTGTVNLNTQILATLNCEGRDSQRYPDKGNIVLKANGFTINVSTCTVTTPSNATLNLGNFNSNHFPAVGSTAGNAAYTISLSCDANVNLKATASDQSNSSNRSTIIGLSSNSTARGLGVQVFYNGSSTALSLGPDSASAGNLNQFSIIRTSSNHQIVNVPLQFKYIRTGTISAGTANAIAGITFSYQ